MSYLLTSPWGAFKSKYLNIQFSRPGTGSLVVKFSHTISESLSDCGNFPITTWSGIKKCLLTARSVSSHTSTTLKLPSVVSSCFIEPDS